MARMTFTEASVAAARPPARGRAEYWDTELPGFGLRVSGGGRKTWQLMYRIDGRKRRMMLGRYPALPLELAREAAFEVLREVARGRDPAAERASVTGGCAMTFEAFAAAYVARYARPSKKSWRVDQRMIERDLLPAWRRRPADSLTRRDVIEVLERVARRHPTAANRRLALIRRMYAWGVEVDLVPATPVTAIRPPAPEVARDRVLSEAEIAALWRACDRAGWPFGPLAKLLLLTAQRRSAVAALRLTDIALADQIWTVPPADRPEAEPHEVPLSAAAVEVLTSLPRPKSAFVFPARGHAGRPVSGFSAAGRRLRTLSGIADLRFDDLRRTALAGMAGLGVSPHVLDAVAGRRRSGPAFLSAAPDRGVDIAARREALELWAARVSEIAAADGRVS